ncbi:excalibur calcium-binding domain-containing protein [Parafrankia colletiae]|uniref:excalibur calcium-binding domain-containing protein n=1 Tax=Parafrankia colletiae TaxID=573497 RepID=UPI001F51D89A|nr:excalibur calcium-binding domain-containing protein [Parafrankia colletiae]
MSAGAGGIFLLLLVGVALLPAPRSAAERSGSAAESAGYPGGVIAGTADRAPTPVPLPPASTARTDSSVPPVRAAAGPASPVVVAEPGAPGAGEAAAGLASTAPRSGAPGSPSTSRHRTKPGPSMPSTAAGGPASAYYRSCGEARAAGAAPLAAGQPGYRAGLDPDGDGVACGRVGPAAWCSTEGSREVPFLTRFGCWISGLGSS